MKASISLKQYNDFKQYISDINNVKSLDEKMKKEYYEKWHFPVIKKLREKFEDMFSLGWIYNNKYAVKESVLNEMDILVAFAASKNRRGK